MPTQAQINVRMDAQLKSMGDGELARMGISPTQLVRAVWMKVAQGAAAIDQLIGVLAQEPAAVSWDGGRRRG